MSSEGGFEHFDRFLDEWSRRDFLRRLSGTVAYAAFRPSSTGFHDCIYVRFDEILIDGDLKLNFAQEVHGQLMSSINLGVALLPAKTLHIHDGQPKDFHSVEGLFDRFQLGRLNDGENQFHGCVRSVW